MGQGQRLLGGGMLDTRGGASKLGSRMESRMKTSAASLRV